MNYWGDLNISTLSGSFGSLMKEKWEQEGEKDKGGRTDGRKEEVEEKEMEEERTEETGEGREQRGKSGGRGAFSDLGKNSASFGRQIMHPPQSDFSVTRSFFRKLQ